MFQSFYESPLQHPWLLLVAPLLFLLRIVSERGVFSRTLLVLTFLTILDPLVCGPVVSLFALPPAVAKGLGILFVIIGDFRWFLMFELCADAHYPAVALSGRAFARAAAFSIVVPILQGLLVQAVPETFDDSRSVFLAYELMSFLLLIVFLGTQRVERPASIRRLQRSLCLYALVYYGLWATSDVLILAGHDVGYLLRVIPNQLYYSFFLPFVWWKVRSISDTELQLG